MVKTGALAHPFFFVLGAVRAKLKCHPYGFLNGKCNVYAVFAPRAGVHTARRGLRRLPMVCHPYGVLFSALRAIETSTGLFFTHLWKGGTV